MKKTLAVLAVLAVAAAAQADLLNTWTVSKSSTVNDNTTGTGLNADKLHFGDLTIPDGQGRYDATSIRMNHLAAGGEITAATAASWSFTLDDGYTFSLDSIKGQLSASATGGVPEFKWASTGKNADVTGAASLQTGGTWEDLTWTATGSPSWTSGDTLTLVPTKATTIEGGNVSATSRTDMKQLQVYGSVTGGDTPTPPTPSVPEPATMSLLGLGALAMALRRKLRK